MIYENNLQDVLKKQMEFLKERGLNSWDFSEYESDSWLACSLEFFFGSLSSLKKSDELTFMQYTGFKDSDGAEIYEGDILQDTHDGVITGAVEMTDGRWQCDGNDLSDAADCHQVIGNIYENPELLEVITK